MSLEERVEKLKLLNSLFEEFILPVIAEQVQERVSEVIRNAVDKDGVYAQEMKKGICVGLEQAAVLPATLFEQAKADLEAMAKEINDGPQGI